MRRPGPDLFVFAVLFAGVFLCRGAAALSTRDVGIDGGVYLDVARHVRDGHGLVASLSPYNAGYPSFPYPSAIYPLWPTILGLVSRFVPMEEAAHLLPFSCYMLAGLAWFLVGRALAPTPLLGGWRGLHGGHVAALAFWLNPVLTAWSVRPYTEPLAWLLVGIAVWRMLVRGGDGRLSAAAEIGVWVALPYFARAQLILLPMALAAGLGAWVLLGPDRKHRIVWSLVALAPSVVLLAAWYGWLTTFLHDPSPSMLVRFDSAHATDALPAVPVMVETDGLVDLLRDRATGFPLAWGRSDKSWDEVFKGLQYLLPLAGVVAALSAPWTGRAGARRLWAKWRAPEGAAHLTLLAFAIGALLSIHLVHKQFSSPWYFDQREGFVAFPAFLVPGLWLLRRGVVARLLAGACFLLALHGGRANFEAGITLSRGAPPTPAHDRLATWLSGQAEGRSTPLVVAVEEGLAQRVAWQTENVGVHWVSTRSATETVMVMMSTLGAEMLVYDRPRETWPFLRAGGRVQAAFERVPRVPGGYTALKRRAAPLPSAPPRQVVLIGTEAAPGGSLGFSRVEIAATQVPPSQRWEVALTGRSGAGTTVVDWARARGLEVDAAGWGPEGVVEPLAAASTSRLIVRRADDLDGARLLAEAAPAEATVLVVCLPTVKTSGVLLLRDPDATPAFRPRAARLGDVAPTVAWLLGLPIDPALGGEARADLLEWEAAGALGRQEELPWSAPASP